MTTNYEANLNLTKAFFINVKDNQIVATNEIYVLKSRMAAKTRSLESKSCQDQHTYSVFQNKYCIHSDS